MQLELNNPCPTCGKRFDVLGSLTYAAHWLRELSEGRCPECDTLVVFESPSSTPNDRLQNATIDELATVRVEEIDLSVRTMNSLHESGIETLGHLVRVPRQQILERLPNSSIEITQLAERLSERGIRW